MVFYIQKMNNGNKGVQNMEIALQRKAGCFGIQHVHKVSNQSDHKEVPESDEWLYSEYSDGNRGHNSVIISGLLCCQVWDILQEIEHVMPYLNYIKSYKILYY